MSRIIRHPEFYPAWPGRGKLLKFQLEEIRRDTSVLGAFVKSVLLEEETTDYLQNAKFTGLEFGEYDFRNRYKWFYDKSIAKFRIQRNDGTVNSPIWTDLLTFDSTSVGPLTKLVEKGGVGTPDTFYKVDAIYVQRPDLTLENNGDGRPVITYNSQLIVEETNTPSPVSVANTTTIKVNRDRGLSVVQQALGIPRLEFNAGQYFYFRKDKLRLDDVGLLETFVAKPEILTSTEIAAITDGLLTNNHAINADFQVWQLGTSITSGTTPANNDATYVCDQWVLLSNGNNIVNIAKETSTVPSGCTTALKATTQTTNTKFGFVQPIESAVAKKLAGQTVSLSFQARMGGSGNLQKIRAAVVSWAGTADSLGSNIDIVSAWNSEGTNPSLVANWTYVNTPVTLSNLTTAYQTYSITNIVIPASPNNLAIFIWIDDTSYSASDILYLSAVQFKFGDAAIQTFRSLNIEDEIWRCERYFEKSFALETAPKDNVTTVGAFASLGNFGGHLNYSWHFRIRKRTVPSIVTYNVSSGTAGYWKAVGSATYQQPTIQFVTDGETRISHTGGVGDNDTYTIHATADARL